MLEKLNQFLENVGQLNVNLALFFFIFIAFVTNITQCNSLSTYQSKTDKKIASLAAANDSLKTQLMIQKIEMTKGINIDSVVNAKLFAPMKMKQELSGVKSSVNSLNQKINKMSK